MNIQFYSPTFANDIKHFSGIPYHIYQQLCANGQVDTIEGYNKYVKLPCVFKKTVYNLFSNNVVDCNLNHYVMQSIGNSISRRVGLNKGVLISPISTYLSYVNTSSIKVFWHDAPFGALVDYYDTHCNFTEKDIRIGNEIQRKAILNADIAVFSSQWAKDYAHNNYDLGNKEIKVIPYGANLPSDFSLEEMRELIKKRIESKKLNLLFLGMDWERKNGPFALQIIRKLKAKGIEANLSVIGCYPEIPFELKENVTIHGYLDKSNKNEMELFQKILSESHFLIGLSQAEAYGILFCEANSYGLPCIANNTGGITTIIRNGINGMKFKIDNGEEQIVEYLLSLFNNHELYGKLAESSFLEFKERLNWKTSVNYLLEIIRNFEKK